MLDQNLLENLLYKTFVLLLMTEQNGMIQDIETEVHHKTIIITKIIIPTQDIVLHLEIDSVMTKISLLHNMTSRYDNYKRDSRSYRSPYRSSYRLPYRRHSRPRYRSRSYSRDNNFQRYTSSFRPPSKPRDPSYSRSRSHSHSRN